MLETEMNIVPRSAGAVALNDVVNRFAETPR